MSATMRATRTYTVIGRIITYVACLSALRSLAHYPAPVGAGSGRLFCLTQRLVQHGLDIRLIRQAPLIGLLARQLDIVLR
jgi:hypothetical protein